VTLPRFLAIGVDSARGVATLSADESKHLTRVLRLGPGDEVEVFDGCGSEYAARVASVARPSVTLQLLRRLESIPEPVVPFIYAQAILKGASMDDVVRDATMLGAGAIVPLISAHVAVKAAGLERGRPAERWRRVALASVKQCRRSRLPEVLDPLRFEDWIAEGSSSALRLLLVEPAAAPEGTKPIRSLFDRRAPASAALVAGPEGGWSAGEVTSAIAAGYEAVTLGPLTLRADAVAVAALSVFRTVWDEAPAPTSPPPRPPR
jgi:16S rRNA (uracil1498-N3)-methyltransferase